MAVTVRIAGAQKNVAPTVRIAGAWKTVGQIHTRVAGTWRPAWSYVWATGAWGACSASCGGGTQTRSVTCQRSDGVGVADAVCVAYVGAKPAVSQSCNTQGCSVCNANASTYYVNNRYYHYVGAGGGQTVGDNDTNFQWNNNPFFTVNSIVSSATYGGCYYYSNGSIITYVDDGYNKYYKYGICRCCPNC